MSGPQHANRIALTVGEPAGIGVDLCVKLAQQTRSYAVVAIADPTLLSQRAALLGLPLQCHSFAPDKACCQEAGQLTVLPLPLATAAVAGQLNPANSAYVLATIERAVRGCLQGEFTAMVTAPVHKGVINEAGVAFSGHTEFIAELTGGYPVMMLVTEGLRVALVTTHLPLAQVSAAITPPVLNNVIRHLNRDLQQRFRIAQPKILVCGLNPHAGEGGHLGREEIEVIEPTLARLRTEGIDLSPCLPADTLFTPKYLQTADVVLAMYHDQGLPVLKYRGFGEAANITLGLPIIRTSVDHGTALDLAGTGLAQSGSLQYALHCALTLCQTTPNMP